MFAADAAAKTLGIELVSAGAGNTLRVRVAEAMVNGHGDPPGSYLFALADTAFACACNSHGPVTVAADTIYVAPAQIGGELVAERAVIAEFRGHSHSVRDRRAP
jgi:acyl-CoA thioesterase